MAIENILADMQRQISDLQYQLDGLRKIESGGVWVAYTPNYTQYTAMTFTTITTERARYSVIGKTCFISMRAWGTLGGSAAAVIDFTPPIVGINDGVGAMIIAGWAQSYLNPINVGQMRTNSSGNVFRVSKADSTNFTVGTTITIRVDGCYEIG